MLKYQQVEATKDETPPTLEKEAEATTDETPATLEKEVEAKADETPVTLEKEGEVTADKIPTTLEKVTTWIQNPKTDDTRINILLILCIFLLAGSGLYVYRRKCK